ncbi:kinase-like domain-containing protein [Mycena rebaudengoi]|nr:kinase-like domain-containing protein [Mycena rebaudengoi]
MSDEEMMHELRRIVCTDNAGTVYSKIEKIGQGPTGHVYLGKRLATGALVVIKEMDMASSIYQPLKFSLNEVFALRSLKHPNIVDYIDSYLVVKDTLWLVTEYMEGGALSDIIRGSQTSMKEDQMSRICAETCRGLAHLHQQNIIHRNIKSHCVLLNSLGQVKIAGFGYCVKLKDHTSKRQSVVGVPHWMAHEMVTRQPYSFKVDVWSLGIVTMEMIERVPPNFSEESSTALHLIVKGGAPTLLRPYNSSSEINSFLAECLCLDVDRRPSSTELLSHDFLKKACDASGLLPLLRPALGLQMPRLR